MEIVSLTEKNMKNSGKHEKSLKKDIEKRLLKAKTLYGVINSRDVLLENNEEKSKTDQASSDMENSIAQKSQIDLKKVSFYFFSKWR